MKLIKQHRYYYPVIDSGVAGLPPEIRTHIFSYLEYHESLKIRFVCKLFTIIVETLFRPPVVEPRESDHNPTMGLFDKENYNVSVKGKRMLKTLHRVWDIIFSYMGIDNLIPLKRVSWLCMVLVKALRLYDFLCITITEPFIDPRRFEMAQRLVSYIKSPKHCFIDEQDMTWDQFREFLERPPLCLSKVYMSHKRVIILLLICVKIPENLISVCTEMPRYFILPQLILSKCTFQSDIDFRPLSSTILLFHDVSYLMCYSREICITMSKEVILIIENFRGRNFTVKLSSIEPKIYLIKNKKIIKGR
jgi:hypothetical protein